MSEILRNLICSNRKARPALETPADRLKIRLRHCRSPTYQPHPSARQARDVFRPNATQMKGRESGMPEEVQWQAFFNADVIVEQLQCAKENHARIAEFGCGYGTFTFPVAKRTTGIVHAFDIEPALVALVQCRARDAGLSNVQAEVRDFVTQGTGLPSTSIDHAMVYNLLHLEEPVRLLTEAFRILKPRGVVSIIHWKPDPATPRGPSMSIRPRPEQCRAWAEAAGFTFLRDHDLSSCGRYHYGLILERPSSEE